MTEAASERPLAALTRWTDYARTVLLAALPIAAAIGAVFLFAYCSEWRVPMPLELAELPTLLLAIAAIGVALCLFAGGVVLLPLGSALLCADGFWPLYVGRRKSLRARWRPNVQARDPERAERRTQRRLHMFRRVLRVFLLTQGVPALVILWPVFSRTFENDAVNAAAFAAAAIVATGSTWYGFHRYAPSRWRLNAAWALLSQVVFQILWNLQCLGFALRWLARFDDEPAWAVVLILVVLPIALLVPSFMLVFARIFSAHALRTLLVGVAVAVVVIPAVKMSWGALITADVLHKLGMGGGLPVTFVVSDDTPPALCERICDDDRPGHSKQLPLLLQVGDRVVVRVEDDVVEFSKQYVVGRVQQAGGPR